MNENKYTSGVDFKFLEAMEIEVFQYQPWQLGLFHRDIQDGKFVWYPRKGTLMFQGNDTTYKIKNTGDFKATRNPNVTELIVEEIMKKVTK